MIYTYKNFAETHLDMEALSEWDVWIAHYAAIIAANGMNGTDHPCDCKMLLERNEILRRKVAELETAALKGK